MCEKGSIHLWNYGEDCTDCLLFRLKKLSNGIKTMAGRFLALSIMYLWHIFRLLQKKTPRDWEPLTNQFLCLHTSPSHTPTCTHHSFPSSPQRSPDIFGTPPQDEVPDPRAWHWNLISQCFPKTSHHTLLSAHTHTHTWKPIPPVPSTSIILGGAVVTDSCIEQGDKRDTALFKRVSLIWARPVALWHPGKWLWHLRGELFSAVTLPLKHVHKSMQSTLRIHTATQTLRLNDTLTLLPLWHNGEKCHLSPQQMCPFITLKLNQLHALDQTYFLIVNSSQTQSYVISEASL